MSLPFLMFTLLLQVHSVHPTETKRSEASPCLPDQRTCLIRDKPQDCNTCFHVIMCHHWLAVRKQAFFYHQTILCVTCKAHLPYSLCLSAYLSILFISSSWTGFKEPLKISEPDTRADLNESVTHLLFHFGPSDKSVKIFVIAHNILKILQLLVTQLCREV